MGQIGGGSGQRAGSAQQQSRAAGKELFHIDLQNKKYGGPAKQDRRKLYLLAAETAQLAENLPDGAAIEVTHLADLLVYLPREDK